MAALTGTLPSPLWIWPWIADRLPKTVELCFILLIVIIYQAAAWFSERQNRFFLSPFLMLLRLVDNSCLTVTPARLQSLKANRNHGVKLETWPLSYSRDCFSLEAAPLLTPIKDKCVSPGKAALSFKEINGCTFACTGSSLLH